MSVFDILFKNNLYKKQIRVCTLAHKDFIDFIGNLVSEEGFEILTRGL